MLPVIRGKCVLLLLILACFSFLAYRMTMYINHYNRHAEEYLYNHAPKINRGPKFTISTAGCNVPDLIPMSESVKKFVNYPKDVPRCLNSSLLLLDHNKTHIWVKEASETNATMRCCYRSFYRPVFIDNIENKVDDRYKYDECVNFTDVIEAKHEFVNVVCENHTHGIEELFLFAPEKKFRKRAKKQLPANAPAYNVLILGIDAVSRLNLYRTMPKTIKFLKSKNSIDLMGYNKVGDNTYPNLIPMLLGISDEEIKTSCLPYKNAKFDNCPFIWEWYKQAGYYTALGEDSSWLGTFNFNKGGFADTPTDYYLHTFINVAEKYARQHKNETVKSTFCFNDKYMYKVLLDYVADLLDTLKLSKLFGFFWEVTMTHDDVNYPMIIDNDYLNFFQNLDRSGYLNETIIFLLSDHGMRWGDLRRTKQGRIEERLPFVFMLMPPSFRQRYEVAYINLQLNQQRLTTPYDVHATLKDLLDLNRITNENIDIRSHQEYARDRSVSLFLPIPSNRTCATTGISDHWCACHKSVTVSKHSKKVKRSSAHLNYYLNMILKDYEQCAKLKIVEVIDASEMVVGKPEKIEENSFRDYMLVVRTEPGNGTFEATVRTDGRKWDIPGTVSRLNLYGNQSACIDDNLLKLYCYCS